MMVSDLNQIKIFTKQGGIMTNIFRKGSIKIRNKTLDI
jgi:hypothetical protein